MNRAYPCKEVRRVYQTCVKDKRYTRELGLLGETQSIVWMDQAVQERAGTIGKLKDEVEEVRVRL